MQISVESNMKEIARHLSVLERRQLPFAVSRSLNKVAEAAQDSIIKSIPHTFNNRRKWWGKNQPIGIKVSFSNKYEQVASVYTRAYFAPMQEEGGTKRPKSGMHIAVPTSNAPKKFHKSNVLKKERGNSRIFKSRDGKGIYRRVGKNRTEKLYSLVPSVTLKKRFGFKQIAYKIFLRRFDNIFNKQLIHAIKTAK